MKRIIFHIPNKIDENPTSGSQIRPMRMLQAFKNIGYEVDVVMGYVKDRKEQIKRIKDNINNGVKYDFLYSESSTMPTALTEKHHLPVAPFLDFDFFYFCKKNHIKIGLFYRDVYWVFDEYKKNISFFKRLLAENFYKYDLRKYAKLLDIFYLPSIEMNEFVPIKINSVTALPPAVEKRNYKPIVEENKLNFIYVGGISDLYDLTLFVKVLKTVSSAKLNLCTRSLEWQKNKAKYTDSQNCIDVFHKKGNELDEIYNQSSIAVYFVKPDILWGFAMGVKLFEYIAFRKPIIAVKGTAVGNFVEKNNIGWVIEYTEDALQKLLNKLQNKPEIIQEKIKNIEKIIPKNTWEARAKQVQKDLGV